MPPPADKATVCSGGGPAVVKGAPFRKVPPALVINKIARPRKLLVLSSDVCVPSHGALEPTFGPPPMFCAERASSKTSTPNELLVHVGGLCLINYGSVLEMIGGINSVGCLV